MSTTRLRRVGIAAVVLIPLAFAGLFVGAVGQGKSAIDSIPVAIVNQDTLQKVTNADGSVDIYLQSASPGGDKESNWLPTPQQGPFFMVLRMYGPEGKLAAGEWQAPQPTVVD